MKIMVSGGAGYIGSHAVRQLIRAGHEPVVLTALSRGTGRRWGTRNSFCRRPARPGQPGAVF